MKKIHLRFQTGADDRFEYISKTIKVSAKYFDTIIYQHIYRDKNCRADALSNDGLKKNNGGLIV